ncbi:hypothetical protein PFICI_04674 [Pestalotiopsis fici W106-1]|uniref:Bis(5'-adenosyl)-triphosphatase n=1 Tax=Pestalotiopsis fici (strain W106-1 / CGMCC3.15140) TaxID=1229662 RepID=W3X9L5_PESFW|nr:uncharacterized protein PFICI_04674 [Pestalotiopsis fici W106-1]ETS82798.1 hypothetical protein PFICI_04674 [Pestalotiopsis fici W106-1]
MSSKPEGPIHFGPFEVTTQVFMTTPHSFALVNIKPLIPGHVLVVPHKPYKRLTDLSPPELTDLFSTVQRVQRMLARHYFTSPASTSDADQKKQSRQQQPAPAGTPEAGSFNIAIQDGTEAGQTVPHLHVHVIPRIRGATAKQGDGPGDAIYELMAAEAGNVGGGFWDRWAAEVGRPVPGGRFDRIEDAERQARSLAEMEDEAEVFRRVLAELEG